MAERIGAIKALKLARLDQESVDEQRAKMLKVCAKRHTETFGREHLTNADQVIRETTHPMAKSVRVVEALYRMFRFHRQKAFQGAIHANPDYMHRYGWAPMKSSARRIERLAAELQEKHTK